MMKKSSAARVAGPVRSVCIPAALLFVFGSATAALGQGAPPASGATGVWFPSGAIALNVANSSTHNELDATGEGSVDYRTSDGGAAWPAGAGNTGRHDTPVTSARAPEVAGAVTSEGDLAACLAQSAFDVNPVLPNASRTFGGTPIGAWAKRVEQRLSMPVAALDAKPSPDGRKLAVTFVTCRASKDAAMPITTIFAVIDESGRIAYLLDEKGNSTFDGYVTSNTSNVYIAYGWLPDSETLLVYAPGFDYGAGGSCEPTPWRTLNLTGHAGVSFETVNQVYSTKGNAELVYLGPSGCVDNPSQIHVVKTATGADSIVFAGSTDQFIRLTGVESMPDGRIEVRFALESGAEGTLLVR